jgi:hypothetical protein
MITRSTGRALRQMEPFAPGEPSARTRQSPALRTVPGSAGQANGVRAHLGPVPNRNAVRPARERAALDELATRAALLTTRDLAALRGRT